VQFKVRDVYIPDPQAVLDELFGNRVLHGEVVDLSDDGTSGGTYLVVKVEGIRSLLMIPSDKVMVTESDKVDNKCIQD